MDKNEKYKKLLEYVIKKKLEKAMQNPKVKQIIIDELTSFKHFVNPHHLS